MAAIPKNQPSNAEREIRAAVVNRLRALYPGARIVHELNVGHGKNRIDVAAITRDRIVAVEIKSERDRLTRLADQVREFGRSCHAVVVAAHERFFESFTYTNGGAGYRESETLSAGARNAEVWHYPLYSGPDVALARARFGVWSAPRFSIPDTRQLLVLLWTEELRSVAVAHRIAGVTRRTPGYTLRDVLWRRLTGAEIEQAVCGQLRQRTFAEADPPIDDKDAAA